MAGNSAAAGVSVSSRLLSVLAAFDESHRSLALSDLAERADLPLPTAHRLVGELARWGALERDADGRYAVGRRLWDIGLLAPGPTNLAQVAAPFLNDLFAATRVTVHLAERDGLQALYLDRLVGNTSVAVLSNTGTRLPLHATGVGKVLLAHAPQPVCDQVLASLTRITPYTIVQPGRLREQLRRARRDGYATTYEEMDLGACSVAVPITRPDGAVVAALGAVVADLKRSRAQLVAALTVAAGGIARGLARQRFVQ